MEWRGAALEIANAEACALVFVQTDLSRPAKLRRKLESIAGVPQ
jgi:hypothetical protein